MTAGQYLYACLLLLHALAAGALVLKRARGSSFLLLRVPEILFAFGLILFLFSYIYATNANMDYVQRFMASHGNLRLAPNSTQERLDACLRYLPLLAADAAALWYFRSRGRRAAAGIRVLPPVQAWALPLTIASGFLYALSSPSFVQTQGIPVLAWVCLVPLLVVLQSVSLPAGIFYGTLAGVIQMMISNFWLGTFNLLTLQFVTVVTLLEYVPFMAISLALLHRSRALGFLVFRRRGPCSTGFARRASWASRGACWEHRNIRSYRSSRSLPWPECGVSRLSSPSQTA